MRQKDISMTYFWWSYCLFCALDEKWWLHSYWRANCVVCYLWASPGWLYHAILTQRQKTGAKIPVLEGLAFLAGWSLKLCWDLFFCFPHSLSSKTQVTVLSFLLCASWASLMFRSVLVTIKLITVPSAAVLWALLAVAQEAGCSPGCQ